MKLADVGFNWVKSVSNDVTLVTLSVVGVDGVVYSVDLLPEVESHVVVGLREKTTYVATVTVSDGVNKASATTEVVIPDLTAPLPVDFLGYTIVNVYDEVPVDLDPVDPVN